MKARYLIAGCLFVFSCLFCACGLDEQEPYNHPFIRITNDNGQTVFEIDRNADYTATYYIYLSSAPLKENLTVRYEIIVGNGLTEGLDYEVINRSRDIVFLPGIYDMPVRIHWLPNENLEETKDNSLTIRLISNSMNFTMGLPGPDQLQQKVIITKR
ncbi:MAG: hypothetical protein LBC40_06520 [Dysgonamonadaceae bacterium]|nr:hypothetical protein [Dysgonamonadaceae bacterium]